jgi:hypothetical protein
VCFNGIFYDNNFLKRIRYSYQRILFLLHFSLVGDRKCRLNIISFIRFIAHKINFSLNSGKCTINDLTIFYNPNIKVKAVKEAEQFAEEDKKRKQKVENRNKLDGMIFSVEQTMKEAGDKLDENDKATLNAAIDAAKKELESEDDERITAAYDKLMQDVQPVFAKLYQQAGGAQGAGQPAGNDTEFHR